MPDEQAFKATDPQLVKAYEAAWVSRIAGGKAATAAALELENVKGLAVRRGFIGTPTEAVGLFPLDSSQPAPEGWRYLKSTETFVPRQGRPGQSAREFLSRHAELGGDPFVLLVKSGLPSHGKTPSGSGGYFMHSPVVVEHGGAIYVKFKGELDEDFGRLDSAVWQPIRLSEFYRAYEAATEERSEEES